MLEIGQVALISQIPTEHPIKLCFTGLMLGLLWGLGSGNSYETTPILLSFGVHFSA